MTKVWIVTEWPPYEGEEITGVFDSVEKAETFYKEREAFWATREFKNYVELYEWDVQ